MPDAARPVRTPDGFDLQGHRGARGARPENTWPAFRHALRAGAVTLELDVAVTADRRVVVSHEPWMNPQICRAPGGEEAIAPGAGQQHNLFEMDYATVARYDCGSQRHPGFPEQQPVAAPKPLLSDVLAEADALAARMGRPLPFYNVEVKTRPAWDGRFHPPPAVFVRLVTGVLAEAGVTARATIQSFDVRALRAARGFGGRLALLAARGSAFEERTQALGFTPDLYSPDHRDVDAALVRQASEHGLAVVPWTVNDPGEMRRLAALGVNGLITDYPRRARFLLEE